MQDVTTFALMGDPSDSDQFVISDELNVDWEARPGEDTKALATGMTEDFERVEGAGEPPATRRQAQRLVDDCVEVMEQAGVFDEHHAVDAYGGMRDGKALNARVTEHGAAAVVARAGGAKAIVAVVNPGEASYEERCEEFGIIGEMMDAELKAPWYGERPYFARTSVSKSKTEPSQDFVDNPDAMKRFRAWFKHSDVTLDESGHHAKKKLAELLMLDAHVVAAYLDEGKPLSQWAAVRLQDIVESPFVYECIVHGVDAARDELEQSDHDALIYECTELMKAVDVEDVKLVHSLLCRAARWKGASS